MSPALTSTSTIPPRRATGHQFVHAFEEMPLFWRIESATKWRAGLIDGQFEISFDSTGDWFVSAIQIAVDNGKIGAEARGQLIDLHNDDDPLMYSMILDAIDLRYASNITERIADELAEHGIRVAA